MKAAAVVRGEERGGRLQVIEIDGPPANVIGASTCDAVVAALEEACSREDVRLVVLRGTGEHFSYGAAIEEHVAAEAPRMLTAVHRVVLALASAPVPTLAAVRGRCLGGGLELALACGLVVVEEGATLASPEVRVGAFAPAATALLEGRIPRAIAEDVLLCGRRLDAAEAVRLGLASRLAPAGGLDAAVHALFDECLAPVSAAVLRVATRAAREASSRQLAVRLAEMEETYLGRLLPLHDATEGIAAFMEKRPPEWRDA